MKIAIGINGAGGRMGQRLVALGKEDPALKIVSALEYHSHPMIGKDAGEIAGIGHLGVPLRSQFHPGRHDECIAHLPAKKNPASDRNHWAYRCRKESPRICSP